MFRFGLLFRGFQTDMPPPSSTIGTGLSIKTPRGNWTTKPDIGAGFMFWVEQEAKKKTLVPVFDMGNPLFCWFGD